MNAKYEKYYKFNLRMTSWVSFHSHLHMQCEIMQVLEGSICATVDGVEYILHENEAVFILPHQIHSFESRGYNKVSTMFVTPFLLPQYSELMRNNTLENPVISLDDTGVTGLCTSITNHLFEKFGCEPDIPSVMLCVDGDALSSSAVGRSLAESYVALLLDGAVWKKKNVSAMTNARRVLEYCLEHYKEDISVYRVAAALGITEHTVTRVFTNVLRCNFRKYINFLRLSDVIRTLTETSDSITDIAKDAGFDTLRTFNRVFSGEYGCSPSDYRKKYRTKE